MGSVRWMLAKDLRILRRSPALSMLLIIYPAAIAVLIGLALSRGPGLPRVAFLNEIPPSRAVITLGSTRIDTTRYERQLFEAIQPVRVSSRAQAIADVRDGSTIAALIIPADLPHLLASAATSARKARRNASFSSVPCQLVPQTAPTRQPSRNGSAPGWTAAIPWWIS